MTTILEHVKAAIADGLPARLEIQDSEPGVTFLDEGEFIPFADLNYNREYGYFQISLLPNIPRECENTPVDGRSLNRGVPGKRSRTWAENTHAVTGYIPPAWADELSRLSDNQSDAVRTAVDVALHPFAADSLPPIRLTDPAPCGISRGDGYCGNPATAAHVYRWRHPTYPGHLVILPVCRECAEKAAAHYQ